jgi:Tfp pilus assembly protein PilX
VIRPAPQRGYILLPVIVVITVVAAIALLMTTESALESNTAASELDAQQARYVAEAGLKHALWQIQQQGCGPYTDISNHPLGPDKYGSSLTTDLGSTSAVTISVEQDSWIRSDQPTINKATDLKLHTRNETLGTERPLIRYDLSPIAAKASILSATAWFYITNAHAAGPIDIHLTSADWTETDATWDSMNTNMDSAILATIPSQPDIGVWIPVNLTAQVQAWVNGQPNYGITLNSSVDGVHGQYNSRESANPPYLEVVVGTPPTSPALLKAVGTLANGINRSITRNDVTLVQNPAGFSLSRITAGSGQDAMLDSFYNNRDYGIHELEVSLGSGSTVENSVLQFELPAIAPGARIISAQLELYHYVTTRSTGNLVVDVHRVTRSWTEGTHDGTGTADGATWDTWDGSSSWTSAGGDYEALSVASSEVSPATGDWESWEIGDLMQGWVDGRFLNHGLLLKGTGDFDISFASREDADPALHPKLSITYACACGQVCVAPQGSGNLLMVVINPTTLVAEDQQAKDLFESWGYTVSVVGESSNQATYDAAVAANDVVFISETVNSGSVGSKLAGAPIGVVSQDGDYNSDLGLASGSALKVGAEISVTDTDHYITRLFAAGPLQVYAAGMEQLIASSAPTAGQQVLADIGGDASLVALEKGDAMEGSGSAAGRRVMLPLGTRYRFNWDHLNANGRLLVQRALAWGLGANKPPGIPLLMVVVDPASLTTQENAKKVLFESWGYNVNLIDESDIQPNFDAAVAVNDVVYITEDVTSGSVNTKLVNAAIGVVTEEDNLSDEFGMAASIAWESGTQVEINDNSHYITSPFSLGLLTFLTANESLAYVTGAQSPDLGRLASSTSGYGVVTLEAGAAMYGGGTAAGRRAQLPWGGDGFDVNHLNDDGLTILQRALEWGAGANLEGGFYLDEFPDFSCDGADEYRGSNGSIDWSGNAWLEVGDDGRACGANLRVLDDPLIDDPTGNRLRLQNSDRGVERMVDLSSFAVANLSFDYRRDGLSGGAAILVEVSGDGGSNWDTLDTIAAGTDAAYLSTNNDISAYIAADTMIRFSSNSSFSGEAYIDNVRIDQAAGATGPIAHWKLDDAVGPTAIDSVGGNDATLNGNPDWTTGVADGALEFDGSGDYATTDNNFTPPPVGTVMFWMKVPGSPGSHGRILGLHDTWEVRHVTTGTPDGIPYGLVFDLGVTGVNTEFATTVTVDAPDQWYFVAATYDTNNDTYQVFLDGTLHKSGTYPSSLAVPAAAPLSLGTRTGSSNYFDGTLDDVKIFNRILSASEIADFYAAGAPSAPGYTELFQPWAAANDATWETFDLGTFGVPENAVVEVAVINSDTGKEHSGGVRAVGSSLERRFLLHEAEGNGVDAVTMHVQADASSQIQHYSAKTGDLSFVLLGYWTGATYVERFDAFKAGANASWQPHDLGAYGVGANQVAEIALSQTSTSIEWLVGARSVGSILQRRIQLHEAESGGIDMVTLQVATDASAMIEVYAEANSVVDFHLLGYWSTPPGAYTENGGVHGQVSTLLTWETNDLGSFGVPADSVVQFVMTNEATGAEVHIGVRESGSTLQRVLDLQEAEGGGSDAASMHVNVDGSAQVEWYSEYGGGTRYFYPVGWWVLSP